MTALFASGHLPVFRKGELEMVSVELH